LVSFFSGHTVVSALRIAAVLLTCERCWTWTSDC